MGSPALDCRLLAAHLSVSLALTVISCGCSAESSGAGGAFVPPAAIRGQSDEAGPTGEAPEPELVLTHDFGLLKPSVQRVHEFEVRNHTAATWTISGFRNSCNCVAARASRKVIRPGETSFIEVEYTAASQTADERRTVHVEFSEPEVRPVRLEVLAQVREALTVEPRDVVFSSVGLGSRPEAILKVFNFSEAPWDGLDVESSSEWLRIDSVVQLEAGFDPAIQAWRVTCAVDAEVLETGRFAASIAVRARGADVQKNIQVAAQTTSPVVAIPGQIYFGEVAIGIAATKRILLRFADGNAPADCSAIAMTHDLAADLRIECAKQSDRFWELTATLAPGLEAGSVVGKATIEFRGTGLPPLSLPVYVRVIDGSVVP